MHLASIDGLSWGRWEWRSRFTPFTTVFDARIMIQQLIFTCWHGAASVQLRNPSPLYTRYNLAPQFRQNPPSALQISLFSALRISLFSALKYLPAILDFLNWFFFSWSISVCWLWASRLKIPMQTPWQQQDLLFLQNNLFEAMLSKITIIKICSSYDCQ